MASTRRKRKTKHRGNAAGIVETRGRTGRRPNDAERKGTAKRTRGDRFNKPPTWRSAFNRAIIAIVLFIVVVVAVLKQSPAAAVALGVFMLLIYVPLGYYTDLMMYRRRQAKLAAARAPAEKP
jgi:glycerol uptake facilitator-like aquaporin